MNLCSFVYQLGQLICDGFVAVAATLVGPLAFLGRCARILLFCSNIIYLKWCVGILVALFGSLFKITNVSPEVIHVTALRPHRMRLGYRKRRQHSQVWPRVPQRSDE